jgi:hypothetical protein
VVHTVVTGGQALLDTLHGAAQLVKQMDAARFVIWLNPFWGPVADNGRTFEQMNLYEAIKKRIETIVSLPAFTDELFPQDIASMLKSRLTFKEAIESPDEWPALIVDCPQVLPSSAYGVLSLAQKCGAGAGYDRGRRGTLSVNIRYSEIWLEIDVAVRKRVSETHGPKTSHPPVSQNSRTRQKTGCERYRQKAR